MNIFDILGPVMVGPSSSHTAGAARIGYITRKLLGEPTEKSKDRIERFFCGNRERTRNRSCSGSRTFGDETR